METTITVKDEIVEALDGLSLEELKAVRQFTHHLASRTPPCIPGEVLIARMNDFEFEPGEVDDMLKAIEEGCEQIDWDGWNASIFD
jgi:hypothetical protein